jgi:hypothetical protein
VGIHFLGHLCQSFPLLIRAVESPRERAEEVVGSGGCHSRRRRGGEGFCGWLESGSGLACFLLMIFCAYFPPCDLQPTGKMLPDSRLDQPLIYLERLELIRNVCRDEALKNLSHTVVSKFVLDRIFVCDKHQILFCQTPKVGNTQWKKVLIVLNGAS